MIYKTPYGDLKTSTRIEKAKFDAVQRQRVHSTTECEQFAVRSELCGGGAEKQDAELLAALRDGVLNEHTPARAAADGRRGAREGGEERRGSSWRNDQGLGAAARHEDEDDGGTGEARGDNDGAGKSCGGGGGRFRLLSPRAPSVSLQRRAFA